MRHTTISQVLSMAFITVLLVVFSASIWEFVLEPPIAGDYSESTEERLEFVFVAAFSVIVALAILVPLVYRTIKERDNLNDRFHLALENMSQGLCLFDSGQRLIVSNRRFAEMYDLPPDQVQPGRRYRDSLEFCVARGHYEGDSPDTYIAESLQLVELEKSESTLQELNNGRSLVITHQLVSQGGWLITHEDVSDYRRIESRLAFLAYHDPLTELPNRALFRDRLDHELLRTQRDGTFALLFLDLDGSKRLTTHLGIKSGICFSRPLPNGCGNAPEMLILLRDWAVMNLQSFR